MNGSIWILCLHVELKVGSPSYSIRIDWVGFAATLGAYIHGSSMESYNLIFITLSEYDGMGMSLSMAKKSTVG